MSTLADHIVIGYSGHAMVALETGLLSGRNFLGYTELQVKDENPFDIQFLGNEQSESFRKTYFGKGFNFVVGIGNNQVRSKIGQELRDLGELTPTLIHPESNCSEKVKMGKGNLVARGTSINPLVVFDNDIIINTAAVIEHGCVIGNGAHIGPGCTLCGDVKVGHQSFLGANSVIIQGISIGENVVIGAGSVVVKDIPSGQTWFGNPARRIK